jgi:hypothetical protein
MPPQLAASSPARPVQPIQDDDRRSRRDERKERRYYPVSPRKLSHLSDPQGRLSLAASRQLQPAPGLLEGPRRWSLQSPGPRSSVHAPAISHVAADTGLLPTQWPNLNFAVA